MSDAQGEEGGHGVIENSAIGAVELGDGGQQEGEGYIFEEVHVGANIEVERVWIVRVAGLAAVVAIELVTNPLLILDALVDDTVHEDEEVAGEGQSPGAGDSWESD